MWKEDSFVSVTMATTPCTETMRSGSPTTQRSGSPAQSVQVYDDALFMEEDPRKTIGIREELIKAIDSGERLSRSHLLMLGHMPTINSFDRFVRSGRTFRRGIFGAALKWAVKKETTPDNAVVRFLINHRIKEMQEEFAKTQHRPEGHYHCSHPLIHPSAPHYSIAGGVIPSHSRDDLLKFCEDLEDETGEQLDMRQFLYSRSIRDWFIPPRVNGKPFEQSGCYVFCKFWRLAHAGYIDPDLYFSIFDESERTNGRSGLVTSEDQLARSVIDFISQKYDNNYRDSKWIPDQLKKRVVKRDDLEEDPECPWGTAEDIYGPGFSSCRQEVPVEESSVVIEEVVDEPTPMEVKTYVEKAPSMVVHSEAIPKPHPFFTEDLEHKKEFHQNHSVFARDVTVEDDLCLSFESLSIPKHFTLTEYGNMFYARLSLHPRRGKLVGMMLENGTAFCHQLHTDLATWETFILDAETALMSRKRKANQNVSVPTTQLSQMTPSVRAFFEHAAEVGFEPSIPKRFNAWEMNPVKPSPVVLCPHTVTSFYHCICGNCVPEGDHLHPFGKLPPLREKLRVKMPRMPKTTPSFAFKRDVVFNRAGKWRKAEGPFGPVSVRVDFKEDLTVCGDVEKNPGPDDTPSLVTEVVETTANVKFIHEDPITTDSIHDGNAVSTFDPHHNIAESPWTLGSLLTRRIEIEYFDWKVGDRGTLRQYAIPSFMFEKTASPVITNLRLWNFLRAGVKLTVMLDGTRFHQGQLIIYHIPPLWVEDQGYYSLENSLNFNHVFANANLSATAELVVTYQHLYSSFPLREGAVRYPSTLTLGTFQIAVFNAMRLSEDVPQFLRVRVFAEFISPEVHQTTYPIERFFSNTGIVQAGPTEEGFAKRWATKLLGAGLKGVLGSLAGGVAGGVASFISGLIFDKPADPMPPERMINYSNLAPCHGAGLDHAVRLSLSPISLSSHNEAVLGGHPGEFDINSLVQKPSRLATFQWSVTDVPNTLKYWQAITPTWVSQVTEPLRGRVTYTPSMLAYISRAFYEWRGSILLTFQFITTDYHRGRLMFVFDPTQVHQLHDVFNDQYQHNPLIVEIKEKKEITIEVPYTSIRPWLRCDNFRSAISYSADPNATKGTYLAESTTGLFYVYVLVPLAAPSNVSQVIDVNVFVRAGKDFTLATIAPLYPLSISRANDTTGRGSNGMYPFIPSDSGEQTFINFPNMVYMENLYYEGFRLFSQRRITEIEQPISFLDVLAKNEQDAELAIWFFKVQELRAYLDGPASPQQTWILKQPLYRNLPLTQGLEVDLTTRDEAGPSISITKGANHVNVVPDTLGEHSMNLQTVMRRYYPLVMGFPIECGVGFGVMRIPVTPTFNAIEFDAIGDQFVLPVPTNQIQWFCRLFTWWKGGLRYMITFDEKSADVYAWHNPFQVDTFSVERAVREADLHYNLSQAQNMCLSRLQGQLTVAVPDVNPNELKLIDAHHGFSSRADLRAQNGTLNIAFRAPNQLSLSGRTVLNVFISTDEDFVVSLLKAAPNVYEYVQTIGKNDQEEGFIVTSPESSRDLDDENQKFPTTVHTGFGFLEGHFRPGWNPPITQMFCPKEIKQCAKQFQEEDVVGTLSSTLKRLDALLETAERKVQDLQQRAEVSQRATIHKYAVVGAQIVTASSVLYCVRNCIEKPTFGSFLTLGTSFAALIGLAVSDSVQNLIHSACDWISNISSLFRESKPSPAKVQIGLNDLEDLIAPYEERILGAVAVLGTLIYACIFDVLPSWKEVKSRVRSFFESEDVQELPKARTQGIDLRAAHFSVLGITALNKVYEKIFAMVQKFIDWILKRDDPKTQVDRADTQVKEKMMSLMDELEFLDSEDVLLQATGNPIIANRYYTACSDARSLTEYCILHKLDSNTSHLCAELRRKANDLKQKLESDNCSYPKRFTPFWLQISGDSQVGKSYLSTIFAKDFVDCFSLSEYNCIYSKNTAEKYWSGYCGQPLVIWDDMYQTSDADEAIGDLYTCISDVDASVNMADVESKGRKFRSVGLISTTNLPYHNLNNTRDNDARRNRIKFHIQMKYRPGWDADRVATDRPNDWSHCVFSILTNQDKGQRSVIQEDLTLDQIRQALRHHLIIHHQREMDKLTQFYGDPDIKSIPRGVMVAPPPENLRPEDIAQNRLQRLRVPAPNDDPAIVFAIGWQCAEGHVAANVAQGLSSAIVGLCPKCVLDEFASLRARCFIQAVMDNEFDFSGMYRDFWRSRTFWQKTRALAKVLWKQLKDKAGAAIDSVSRFIQEHPRFVTVASVCSLLVATAGAVCAVTHGMGQGEGTYESGPRMHRTIRAIESAYESGPSTAPKLKVVESAYESGPSTRPKISVIQSSTDPVACNIAPIIQRAIHVISWASSAKRNGTLRCVQIGGSLILAPFHFFSQADEGDRFYLCHRTSAVACEFNPARLYRPGGKDWCIYDVGNRLEPGKRLFKYFISAADLGRVSKLPGVMLSVDSELERSAYHGTIESARSFEYYDLTLGDVYRQTGWYFSYPTENGMCGSPLMGLHSQLPAPGKVLGIHTAGYTGKNRGFSVLVTRESLEEAALHLAPSVQNIVQPAPFIEEGEYGYEAMKKARIIPKGDYTMHCVMPAKCCPSQPIKTTFVQTPWFEQESAIAPSPKIPAPLRPFVKNGERISPLAIALAKYGKDTLDFPERDVQKVSGYVLHIFQEHLISQTGKSVWSEHDAIVGIPAVPFAERLNMKSSPGLPYQLMKRTPGKWDLFDENSNVKPNTLLRHRLDERLEAAKEGQLYTSIWRDCLKDELRPREKAEAGKTRLFTIAPVDFTILLRRYTMDFVLAFYSANVDFFSAVGINPESFEWTALYNKLRECGNQCIAGDFKAFDGTLLAQLMMECCHIINQWYDDGEENARVRIVLFTELIHTIQQVENLVYQTHQGNPSGNPLTVIINTIIGFMYFCLAFVHIVPGATLDDFTRYVRSIHYGDDNVTVVHPKFKIFNFNTIRNYLLRFGIEYTLDTKTAQDTYPDFRPLEEVTFLKRGFRQDPEFGFSAVVPVMSTETLNSFFYYYRKAIDIESQLQENMRAALIFAAFHGREFYKEYQAKWVNHMRDYGFKTPYISFEEQVDVFRSTCGQTREATGLELSLPKKAGLAEGMDAFMELSSSKPARILGGIFEAPLYYALAAIGSTSGPDEIERTDDRWAAAIPSGEGKSFLCKLYPHVFVDHDELLLPHFTCKKYVRGHNPWSHAFAREQDFPVGDRRILLVHHPSDTKRQLIGSFITHRPTFIRTNILQRLSLYKPFKMSREERNDYLVSFAKEREPSLFAPS